MAREIGSEFSRVEEDNGLGMVYPVPGKLVFSGRTALETVLKEIPYARSAILPSYCCDSMIQPFRDANIEIFFYSVEYQNGIEVKVNIPNNIDIFLWTNYFGFRTPMPDLEGFNGIIIEDITHSLFSRYTYHSQSHYLVASIRKWVPINCGGYCASTFGELKNAPTLEPPEMIMNKKRIAMKMKADYLIDLDVEKKEKYLSLFEETNKCFSSNYSGLAIDELSSRYLCSIDMERIRRIRKQNAKVLYDEIPSKYMIFAESDMDCPLFVPIFLENRDFVRKAMIDNEIYCPIHWPKPKECSSNLYESELSLICDQRYNENDMERIVKVLKQLL